MESQSTYMSQRSGLCVIHIENFQELPDCLFMKQLKRRLVLQIVQTAELRNLIRLRKIEKSQWCTIVTWQYLFWQSIAFLEKILNLRLLNVRILLPFMLRLWPSDACSLGMSWLLKSMGVEAKLWIVKRPQVAQSAPRHFSSWRGEWLTQIDLPSEP